MTGKMFFKLLFDMLRYWCQERARADREDDDDAAFSAFVSVGTLIKFADSVLEAELDWARVHLGEQELLDLYTYASGQLGHWHDVCNLIGTFCINAANLIGGHQLVTSLAHKFDQIGAASKD